MNANLSNLIDVDSYAEQQNSELAEALLPNTILFFIILIFGTFANGVVLYIYTFAMKKKQDRFFIPWLSLTDLGTCLFGSTFGIYLNYNRRLTRSDGFCKTAWFVNSFSVYFGGYLLLIIAIQRYLKICRPFGRQMTHDLGKVALSVILIPSLLMAFPSTIFRGVSEVPARNLDSTAPPGVVYFVCDVIKDEDQPPGFSAYNSILGSVAVVGITVVTVLYVFIGHKMFTQLKFRKEHLNKKKQKASTSTEPDVNSNVSDRKYSNASQLSGVQSVGREKTIECTESEDEAAETDKNIKRLPESRNPISTIDVNIPINQIESSEHHVTIPIIDIIPPSDGINASPIIDYETNILNCGDNLSIQLTDEEIEQISNHENSFNSNTIRHDSLSVDSKIETQQRIGSDSSCESLDTVSMNTNVTLLSVKSTAKPHGHHHHHLKPIKKTLFKTVKKTQSFFTTHRYSVIFILITVSFLLAFVPQIYLMVMETVIENFWFHLSNIEYSENLFLHQMYLIHSFCNPIIYVILDEKFKEAISKKFTCCLVRLRRRPAIVVN